MASLLRHLPDAIATECEWAAEQYRSLGRRLPDDWDSRFRISETSSRLISLSCGEWRLTVDCEDRAAGQRLAEAHWPAVVEILGMDILLSPGHDLLWIEQAEGARRFWVLGLDGCLRSDRQAMLLEREVHPDKIDWLLSRGDEGGMATFARAALDFLTDKSQLGLPETFSVIRRDPRDRPRSARLLVRVGRGVSWPFVLPLDHWASHPERQYGGFARYQSVDWILTGRTFAQTLRERVELDALLRNDRVGFLRQSVFIVNHNYRHWDVPARRRVGAGVDLLREVVGTLNASGGSDAAGRIGVNVVYNPTASQVDGLLRDRSHRVIFANFHTDEGRWMVSPEGHKTEPIDLAAYVPGRQLRHIALLSANHCCSVADPTSREATRSICQTLLDAGVRRVSGNVVEEYAEDYLCRLLHLFCDARGLGFLLWSACWACDVDFQELLRRVHTFLEGRGYGHVDTNMTVHGKERDP